MQHDRDLAGVDLDVICPERHGCSPHSGRSATPVADRLRVLRAAVADVGPAPMPHSFERARSCTLGATSLLGLGVCFNSLEDLVLVCTADGRLLTTAALLQELSPNVLKDMLAVAMESQDEDLITKLPMLQDSEGDWTLLLKLAQQSEPKDLSGITWGQSRRLLQLMHKYDMTGFRATGLEVLKTVLKRDAQASAHSGITARDLLDALSDAQHLGMADVTNVLVQAIRTRLKAAHCAESMKQAAGNQCVEELNKWTAAFMVSAQPTQPDGAGSTPSPASVSPPDAANINGAPSRPSHADPEDGMMAIRLLSIVMPLHQELLTLQRTTYADLCESQAKARHTLTTVPSLPVARRPLHQ